MPSKGCLSGQVKTLGRFSYTPTFTSLVEAAACIVEKRNVPMPMMKIRRKMRVRHLGGVPDAIMMADPRSSDDAKQKESE